MATKQNLQYINLTDFSPGIFSSYQSGATGNQDSVQDGAAQKTGTYGCYGNPSGGLYPLPLVSVEDTISLDHVAGSSVFPADRRFIAILDVLNFPGIHPPDFVVVNSGISPTPEAHPISSDFSGKPALIYFVAQRYYADGNDAAYERQWAVYRRSLYLDPAMDAIDSAYGASQPVFRFPWGGHDTNPRIAQDFGFGVLDLGRESTADQTKPGQPHFKIGLGGRINSPSEDEVTYDYRSVYLSSSSLDNDNHIQVINEIGPSIVLSHQGRTVWCNVTPDVTQQRSESTIYEQYRGVNWLVDVLSTAGVITSEELYWTKVNSADIDNPDGTVFVEENPVGLGIWCSMNANELFLVKHWGGAVLVRGSLNNPTVIRLPGVESTFGICSHPVVTPMGCVYGTKTGVWVWNGSDTATCISPQLDGYFWRVPNTEFYHQAQVVGRFGYQHPFLFAPNNWVMDVRTGGWFRLIETGLTADDEGAKFAFYNTSFQNLVYASPATLPLSDNNDLEAQPWLYTIDYMAAAKNFRWTSQPLQKTQTRRLDFRDAMIVTQGVGTVTVTLTGLDGDTWSYVFTVDSPDVPIALDAPTVKLSSHDVIVSIESAGVDAAPIVYRCSIGYDEAQQITEGGSVA